MLYKAYRNTSENKEMHSNQQKGQPLSFSFFYLCQVPFRCLVCFVLDFLFYFVSIPSLPVCVSSGCLYSLCVWLSIVFTCVSLSPLLLGIYASLSQCVFVRLSSLVSSFPALFPLVWFLVFDPVYSLVIWYFCLRLLFAGFGPCLVLDSPFCHVFLYFCLCWLSFCVLTLDC